MVVGDGAEGLILHRSRHVSIHAREWNVQGSDANGSI